METLGPVIGPVFGEVKRTELEAYNLEVFGCEQRSYLETL